jgi:hypothetical protein
LKDEILTCVGSSDQLQSDNILKDFGVFLKRSFGRLYFGIASSSEEEALFLQFIADTNSKRGKNCLRQNNAVLRTAALLSGPTPAPDRAR